MRRWLVVVAGVATLLGCDPRPRTLPCGTYVAGSFNRENHFAFSLDEPWPPLGTEGSSIELTLLLASGKPQTVDLVHVSGDREIERWALHVPTDSGRLPICVLTSHPDTSKCGATIRIVPHDVRGYWYLRSNDDLLEAGMSFVLCK